LPDRSMNIGENEDLSSKNLSSGYFGQNLPTMIRIQTLRSEHDITRTRGLDEN